MRMKFRGVGLFVGVAMLAIFLSGPLAHAQKKPSPPVPADPAIAYSLSGPNRLDIMVMDANGSNKRVVVSEKMVNNLNPDWSPDGKQLVFTRFGLKGGDNGIYIINVDGTGLKNVTDFNGKSAYVHAVAWSPQPLADGQYKIAFVDQADLGGGSLKPITDLFIVNTDGSGLVQLTNDKNGAQHWEVQWSPEGDRIAVETFTHNTGEPGIGDIVVYQIAYDNSTAAKFKATSLGSVIPSVEPLATDVDRLLYDWSKQGNNLLISASVVGAPTFSGLQPDLWKIDVTEPASPVPTQLTLATTPWSASAASWSPDGKEIVFLRGGYFWVMDSNGFGAKTIASANNVYFKGLNWRRNILPQ
jgi:Tol biopolymer transport system component